jgi:hypothetical protein
MHREAGRAKDLSAPLYVLRKSVWKTSNKKPKILKLNSRLIFTELKCGHFYNSEKSEGIRRRGIKHLAFVGHHVGLLPGIES